MLRLDLLTAADSVCCGDHKNNDNNVVDDNNDRVNVIILEIR